METVAFIIIIAGLIILASIVIYFIKDYVEYKSQINTQFSVTESKVNAEKLDRLSNLRYVVDQVNTVNDDIASTLDKETTNQTTLASELDASQKNYLAGLNSAFKFRDNSGKQISLTDLPGSVQPNTEVLTNIIATMGLTAKDLEPNGNKVKLCSKKDPSKCIQFPDNNGNTYLTDMDNGSVIIDGTKGAIINNGINLTGGLNINSATGTPSGAITPGPNQMVLKSAKIGVGKFTSSAPNATLHVIPDNTNDNVLQLAASSGQQMITVTPSGAINIYTDSARVGTIEPTTTGLRITANTLEVNGNLVVNGGTISGRLNAPGPA